MPFLVDLGFKMVAIVYSCSNTDCVFFVDLLEKKLNFSRVLYLFYMRYLYLN